MKSRHLPKFLLSAVSALQAIAVLLFAGHLDSAFAKPAQRNIHYDIIVKNGLIYDGSGSKPFAGDVAIRGDRIAALDHHIHGTAKRMIDARGKAVAPGFINAMSWATYSLMTDPSAESDLRQGITLEILGEGVSPGPLNEEMARARDQDSAVPRSFRWRGFGEYFSGLEERGTSVNFAAWVGATTIRTYVLGAANVRPTPDQLLQMRALVAQSMEEGALGLSSALIYAPGVFADTDELKALTGEAGRCGGMYVSHMRSEGARFLEALDELIAISEYSGAPAEVFHIKVGDPRNWPKMDVALQKIREARARGIRITADMYPYPASGTGLTASIPPWAQEGGLDALILRLKNPEQRMKIIADMQDSAPKWENVMQGAGGAEGVVFGAFRSPALQKLTGLTLAKVAAQRGVSPEETILELIEEDQSSVFTLYFTMNEANLRKQIQEPYMSFGSDGPALSSDSKEIGSHPRAFGTFARIFAKYVQEEKLLSMEEAVRRLTSLPATNYSIADRGRLRVGNFADVVIFDPSTFQDHATYAKPAQFATGVEQVIVNGVVVLADGEPTGARPGKFIRGRAFKDAGTGGCRGLASDWRWPGIGRPIHH